MGAKSSKIRPEMTCAPFACEVIKSRAITLMDRSTFPIIKEVPTIQEIYDTITQAGFKVEVHEIPFNKQFASFIDKEIQTILKDAIPFPILISFINPKPNDDHIVAAIYKEDEGYEIYEQTEGKILLRFNESIFNNERIQELYIKRGTRIAEIFIVKPKNWRDTPEPDMGGSAGRSFAKK